MVDCTLENLLRGRKLKRVLEQMYQHLRKEHGLKQIEIEIIYYIARTPEQRMISAEICNQLLLNKGQVSQSMESLKNRGYLEALEDEVDKRIVWYHLTDASKEMVRELENGQRIFQRKMFEGISEEERECFKRVATKILCNLDQWNE